MNVHNARQRFRLRSGIRRRCGPDRARSEQQSEDRAGAKDVMDE
jgi:hypothetical protein